MFCLIKEVEDGEDSVVLLLGLYREVTSHIQQADEGCRPTRQVCPHAEVSVDYYPSAIFWLEGYCYPSGNFWPEGIDVIFTVPPSTNPNFCLGQYSETKHDSCSIFSGQINLT